jgi:hypothetical protein
MALPPLTRDEVKKRIDKGARAKYSSKEPVKFNAWTVIAMVEKGKMTIPMLQLKAQYLRRVSRLQWLA